MEERCSEKDPFQDIGNLETAFVRFEKHSKGPEINFKLLLSVFNAVFKAWEINTKYLQFTKKNNRSNNVIISRLVANHGLEILGCQNILRELNELCFFTFILVKRASLVPFAITL